MQLRFEEDRFMCSQVLCGLLQADEHPVYSSQNRKQSLDLCSFVHNTEAFSAESDREAPVVVLPTPNMVTKGLYLLCYTVDWTVM